MTYDLRHLSERGGYIKIKFKDIITIQSVHLLKFMLVTLTDLAHSVSQRPRIPAVR